MSLTQTLAGAETCPVCGARGGKTIYAEARDPITLDSFQVIECFACGVAYTSPRPSSLDKYYPQRYRGYGGFVTRVLSALYSLRVSRWACLNHEGNSVLEVGCGPGLMLATFHRRGWRTLGIERNEAVAEKARRALGVEIVATPVEALPADARFDLIIMFQLLEHISEPVALLRECAKRLAPGGHLITNVPNFSSWQSRFAGPMWLHLDVPRHLAHFTPKTLATTLAQAGLKLSTLSFASLEHDPYGWVESTINKVTGRANTFTRFLMGLDPFGPAVLLSGVLGVVLVLPAVLLSVVSWGAGRGALLEAIATKAAPAEK
jgi:2-polyprenyl-3-methyl-5-hydroxy-6-metoxy-1,4-benzoquinol methylase